MAFFGILKFCFTGILFELSLCHQLQVKVIHDLVDYGEALGRRHNIQWRAADPSNSNASLNIQPSSSSSFRPVMSVSLSGSNISLQSAAGFSTVASSTLSINRTSLFPTATYSAVKTIIPFVPTHMVSKTMLPTRGTTPHSASTEQPTDAVSSTQNGSYKRTTNRPTTSKQEPEQSTPSGLEYIQDNHKYYKSRYYRGGQQWWFNLDEGKSATFHEELSKNIKFSDSLKSSFNFPYYGHLIHNVTITNKGYVFLGERLHKFNASAQYVAPLMADFGADIHNRTAIRYVDTGDRFTVEWANMRLNNEGKENSGKEFSFQCSIFKNGKLVFAYKKIPIPVVDLKDGSLVVRVGLSDTFRREVFKPGRVRIREKWYSGVRIIYYYLYHKVVLDKANVVDGSAIVLIPEPNCVMFKTCDSCVNTRTAFSCAWCPRLQRCSDGIDRHQQEWESAGCKKNSVTKCKAEKDSGLGAGEIVLIVLIIVIILMLICWFVYAYRHPQSKSGMVLIQYGNPTKWCRSCCGQKSGSEGGRISFKTMSFESNA